MYSCIAVIVPILVKCSIITLQDLFGLPCGTTCDKFSKKETLEPGYNSDVLDQAASLYLDGPVIEASDEARALRSGYCINKINLNTLSLYENRCPVLVSVIRTSIIILS